MEKTKIYYEEEAHSRRTIADKWIVREMNVAYEGGVTRIWCPSTNPYASFSQAWGTVVR